MEVFFISIALIFLAIYGLGVLKDFIEMIWKLRSKQESFKEQIQNKRVSKLTVIQEVEEILHTSSNYYIQLDSEQKKKFIQRTMYFMQHTQYNVYEGVVLTNVLRVLIAACAVQITFGLNVCLSLKIKKIRLYPDLMYIRSRNTYVKGFFHPHGVVHVSVKHFIEGHNNQSDGIHLGLHEMAHAMEQIILSNNSFSFLFKDLVSKWIHATEETTDYSIDKEEHAFIRKYGITNTHEFFAVCIENFFERPREFASKLPMIYKHMCIILNQNPIEPLPHTWVPIIHNNYTKPKFTETMHMKQLALITIFSAILISYLLYESFESGSAMPIIFFVSTYNIAKIIEFFTARRMEFYDNYILFRSMLWGTKDIIPTKHLLYISAHQTLASDVRKKLSFVYHKQGLQETHDIFIPEKTFLEQVKAYAKSNNFVFIDKTEG